MACLRDLLVGLDGPGARPAGAHFRVGVGLGAADSGIYLVQQVDLSRQRIVAVDPASGEPLWRFDAATDLAIAPAAVSGLWCSGLRERIPERYAGAYVG